MTRQYKTILIVDDDPDDAEMFLDAVHDVDKAVECYYAKDGEEALSMLLNGAHDRRPDLIVLDMNMPRMNGKQCLRQLKSNRQLSDIPVIIYSTSKMDDFVKEVKNMGAMNFVAKPSKFSDLVQIVTEMLAGKCVFQ